MQFQCRKTTNIAPHSLSLSCSQGKTKKKSPKITIFFRILLCFPGKSRPLHKTPASGKLSFVSSSLTGLLLLVEQSTSSVRPQPQLFCLYFILHGSFGMWDRNSILGLGIGILNSQFSTGYVGLGIGNKLKVLIQFLILDGGVNDQKLFSGL